MSNLSGARGTTAAETLTSPATSRAAGFDPRDDPPAAPPTPGAFRVSTMLMQDAVADAGVSVGEGPVNQEAVFSNRFKAGREEALVIARDGSLTYLERTDTTDTGWHQRTLLDAQKAPYLLSEVVTAQHPSGDIWAICSPADQNTHAFGLKLVSEGQEPGGTAQCDWGEYFDFGVEAYFARSLCVSYSPDSGPLIMGSMQAPNTGPDFLFTAKLPRPGAQIPPWTPPPKILGAQSFPVVGGGLLPADPRTGRINVVVRYYLNGQQLLRVDSYPDGTFAGPTVVASNVAQFCGSYYVPYLNQDAPQGDVGCMFVTADGSLTTAYSNMPGGYLHFDRVPGLDFAAQTKCWQDADGLLHVFGINSDAMLQVLHQTNWQGTYEQNGHPVTCPQWTSAAVAGAPAGIGGFALGDAGDRLTAFDFTGSGKSDHLLAYGPGPTPSSTAASVLASQPDGSFVTVDTTVFPVSTAATGAGVTPIDFTGSGGADHLLVTPGLPAVTLFTGVKGALTPLGPAGPITANAPFQPGDGIVAFDYTGTGKNNHLLVYRSGAGLAWVLAPTGQPSQYPYKVVASLHGVGDFDLANSADLVIGLDYDRKGSATHLLLYRPGGRAAYIVTPDGKGGFTTVLASHSGIGGYDLKVSEDRLLAFDYTRSGFNDHILAYRPGNIPGHSDQQAWVLERNAGSNTYRELVPPSSTHGLGGYDLAVSTDRIVGLDYTGTGGLCYLVAYRPGAGKVTVMGQRGANDIAAVYQAPPAPSVPVTVGLHAEVVDFQLDPYPDYKPSELIKMSGAMAQEAYCICTQDVTTNQWQTDKVRMPAPDPDKPPQPSIVSHYVAQATLLDTRGMPMPGYTVSVSADSLVEAQMSGISYQVGPGRPVRVVTDSQGKVVVSVAARGLNPPVVRLIADGLAAGEAIDFGTGVNDFLAGNGTLPSQQGKFTPELLAGATSTPDGPGLDAAPLADWTALKERGITPQVVVDHCSNVYGMAAGAPELRRVVFEGFDEPQPIVGYVIQLWDPERPAFQAFRTVEELNAYKARRTTHPAYGGWWDDVTSWASDVWEGIKSGAAKVAEVIVSTVVEIAVWVGDAIVSLGEIVIDAIEQAVHAVEAVFQMIADAIMRVIDWLKALFSFGDIWDTKTAMQGMLSQVPGQLSAAAAHYGWVTAKWFTAQKVTIHNKLMDLKAEYADTRMGDFDNKIPPLTSSDGSNVQKDGLQSNPQANWARNKFMGDSASIHVSAALGAVAGPVTLEQAFLNLVGDINNGNPSPLDQFAAALAKFGQAAAALFDPDAAAGSAIASLIDGIDDAVQALLTLLSNIVTSGLALVNAFAAGLEAILTTTLDLGPLNVLWDWFMSLAGHPGEALTVSSLFCLIAGFFVTVVYKLIVGVNNPPFPGGVFPQAPPFGTDLTATAKVPFVPDGGACYGFNIAAGLLVATVYNGLEVGTNFISDNPTLNWAYWFFGLVALVAFPMPWTFTGTAYSAWWGPWTVWAFASGMGFATIQFGSKIQGNNAVLKQWGKLGASLTFGVGVGALVLSIIASGNENDPPPMLATAVLGCISSITAPLIPIADAAGDKKQGFLIAKSVIDVLGNAAAGIMAVVYNSIAVDGRIRLTSPGASPNNAGGTICQITDAYIGETYDYRLTATGSNPPFSYALGSGAPFTKDAVDKLPTGMTWSVVKDANDRQQFVFGGAPSDPKQIVGDVGIWATDSNNYPPFNAALECWFVINPTRVQSAAVAAGDNQTAEVSSLFATALAVTVTGTSGSPMAGAAVTFTAPATGPSGTFPDGTTSATVTSGPDGVATAPMLIANGATGTFQVTAAVPGVPGATATFKSLTNAASTVDTIAATSGNNQSTFSENLFSDSIKATLTAQGGGKLANRLVTFTCPAPADGQFNSNKQQSIRVLTDADGVALAGLFRAGTVATGGSQVNFAVSATVAGSTATPAEFNLTILPPPQLRRRNTTP